ncbi:hypothetical protein [Streptomyces chattanoogensis]|uniref:hypothetical protein n=1 Tax=Streptomyces chattanoogensis TaxID=66876 RepID=UPI0012FED9A1|nr:hypothetical protein [Streptomyces chattanoogensis]
MTSRCGSSWPERGRQRADDPAEALREADRRKAESAVTELGCVPLPEPLLNRSYDGVTGLRAIHCR